MLFNIIINISRYSPLFAFIVSALLSLWIYLNNPRSPKNIFYSLFGLDLAIWALSCFVQSVTQDYQTALFFDQILYTVAAIAPALFLHCISLFAGKDRKRIIISSYLAGLLFMIINWTPYFRQGVNLNFGMRYVTTPGVGWYLYLLAYTIIVVIAVYDLISAILKKSGEERRQLLFVLYAFIILLLGGQSYFILIFKKFNYFIDSTLNLSSSVLLSLYNLLMALIITKYRFLNIRVIISRTLAEVMALSFFGAIYLLLVWIYRTNISTSIDLFFILFNLLYGAIVVRSHHGVRLFLQTTADKLILRGKYDYYKELSDITSEITKTLSTDNILGALKRAFYEVLEVSNPRIYLPEDFNKPEIKELLAVKELTYKGEDLIIPCLLEDRLITLIVLGKKLSEDPYTDEDLRLLKVLASQTAVALDHTRTYEEIRGELEANQQKLVEAERQLERSQRLASLGTLAAGVAHEIRNPLGIICAAAEEAADVPRDKAYLEEFKNSVLRNARRISSIISNMLSLSKTREKKITEIDLNEVINSTIQLFTISGIKLIKELNPVSKIKGDADEIRQVIINLTNNAIEAMPAGGNLTIKTYQVGNKVCLEFSDTGKGIPRENLTRIFDPFFSTRHEGAGLGLSIIYRIVREHGGEINVESEIGKWTTFKIDFPLPI